MKTKLNEILCQHCGSQLVVEDENGNLSFGKHEFWCPAINPREGSPGRKAAKDKLICGQACKSTNAAISDFGDFSVCGVCKNRHLAKEALHRQMSKTGKRPLEVVYPARRELNNAWKLLYLDLLKRYVELDELFKPDQ